jgi:hypothetical protein
MGKGLTPDHPDLHAHFSYPCHPCHPWSNSLFWERNYKGTKEFQPRISRMFFRIRVSWERV